MNIPNRVSAKQAREEADDKSQKDVIAELTKIYDKIHANKKDGETTIYGGISNLARKELWDDGYIVKENVQTGMNEYGTVIKW